MERVIGVALVVGPLTFVGSTFLLNTMIVALSIGLLVMIASTRRHGGARE